jgi:predicted small lipoprotein YifL
MNTIHAAKNVIGTGLRRVVAALALLALLAGCGQKGPLYLPQAEGTGEEPELPVPSTVEEY